MQAIAVKPMGWGIRMLEIRFYSHAGDLSIVCPANEARHVQRKKRITKGQVMKNAGECTVRL